MRVDVFLSAILSIGINICFAQSNIDSISRKRADMVLHNFDTLPTSKVLYSILNTFYYVVYPVERGYRELFVKIDSLGMISKTEVVRTAPLQHEVLSKAFNIDNYDQEYITSMPGASEVSGNISYFVLKDVNGKRYGEYCLSALTSPVPINRELYKYLFVELANCIGH
ncbi:hypothetical protein [Chitinophaga nivalis]|uniref:DUF4252 domain-containing protein n=1 Tax=Chitinophaga nivalis TaxID=2991709 RepID=A0ABT3IJT9_9BACT|nr:hypothetical protein [Chitinophaga nivalis]MCW3466295.1 hypothetical protein [Chitinophaga nivalis]MCW3484014.1 hypothetical protein [Chitinophaga nivalis]